MTPSKKWISRSIPDFFGRKGSPPSGPPHGKGGNLGSDQIERELCTVAKSVALRRICTYVIKSFTGSPFNNQMEDANTKGAVKSVMFNPRDVQPDRGRVGPQPLSIAFQGRFRARNRPFLCLGRLDRDPSDQVTYPGGDRHCQSAAYGNPDGPAQQRRATCASPCDAKGHQSK
jgi:hypothetical protein